MSDFARSAEALLDGTLSPEGFSHRAHVGAAYELLRRHDVFDALALYARGLRALTRRAGVPDKFSATVTFAFISLIAARMAQDHCGSAEAFVTANPDLLRADILSDHYPAEVLNSALARRVPLLPGAKLV